MKENENNIKLMNLTHIIYLQINKMDTRDIHVFRKLATNQYMSNFDYEKYKLSFQTVFFICNFKYCCCPCAFDHEWLTYVNENGKIDEELYARVETNILNRKCPHVDLVTSDYVRETAIYGIHLAAAVGTEKTEKDLGFTYWWDLYSSIFKLTPFSLAVLKKNVMIAARRLKTYIKHLEPQLTNQKHAYVRLFTVVSPERSPTNKNVMQLSSESLLEFCVRSGETELLRKFLFPRMLRIGRYMTELVKSLVLAVKHNSVGIINEVIKFLTHLPSSWTRGFAVGKEGIDTIVARLVIMNEPVILEQVLHEHCRGHNACTVLGDILKYSLTKLCAARDHDLCYNILCKYKVLTMPFTDGTRPYVTGTHAQVLLRMFDDFPDIMAHELESLPGLHSVLIGFGALVSGNKTVFLYPDNSPMLYMYNLFAEARRHYLSENCICVIKPTCRQVLKWLLRQNIIVDTVCTNEYHQKMLTNLLEKCLGSLDFRANFHMLLYSNVEIQPSVFEHCLNS